MAASIKAGWSGRGEGRKEREKEAAFKGTESGGRGTGLRRLWNVLVSLQKPLRGSTAGAEGGFPSAMASGEQEQEQVEMLVVEISELIATKRKIKSKLAR